MPGRVMREYVVAPKALVAKPKEFQAWLSKAFRFGASLPAKPAKKPRVARKK